MMELLLGWAILIALSGGAATGNWKIAGGMLVGVALMDATWRFAIWLASREKDSE